MNKFSSNIHELIYCWRPRDQITAVEYVEMINDDEIELNRLESLVAVPTIRNYTTYEMRESEYKNKILIVDD